MEKITPEMMSELLVAFDEVTSDGLSLESAIASHPSLDTVALKLLQDMVEADAKSGFLDEQIDVFAERLMGADCLVIQASPEDIIGQEFGPWKALHELDGGGMGQVFVAQRDDGQFQKEVALKVIKAGPYSPLTEQRFNEEMQTLAGLEHPNIARLIDGGRSQEQVAYIAMELVDGVGICDYTKDHGLNVSERLALILQVCAAVEYAHQHLIIHGDIKPNNVLVNQNQVVKLIDFGVARPIDSERSGFLPLHTPGYAAPEQIAGKQLSTASDVFGLCALMHEVLTGEPPKQVDSQASASDGPYHQQMPAELRSIIRKGLSDSLTDRYQNVIELRQEIQRFLSHEPVQSHSDSLWYWWSKQWQKQKLFYGTLAAGMLGVLAFGFLALYQAKQAQTSTQKAQWINEFLLGIFDRADPIKNQQQPITVNQLTQLAADDLLQSNDLVAEVKVDALGLLGQIQYKLGQMDSAKEIRLDQIRLMKTGDYSAAEMAKAYSQTGVLMEATDDLEQSNQHLKQALGHLPLAADVNGINVTAAQSLASSLVRLNQLDEAQNLVDELLSHKNAITKLKRQDALMASIHATQARIDMANAAFEKALKHIRQARTYEVNLQQESTLLAMIIGIESDIHYEKGDSQKAAEIDQQLVTFYRKTYGEDHPETLDAMARLAVSFSTTGEMQAAMDLYQKIIAIQEIKETKSHLLPAAYQNMGTALRVLRQHQDALKFYQKAAALWPDISPRLPFYEASTHVGMAGSMLALERLSTAEYHYLQALKIIESEVGLGHPLMSRFHIMYAALLLKQERLDEAGVLIRKAYGNIAEAYGESSKRTAIAALRWAQLAELQGDWVDMKKYAGMAVKVLENPAISKRYQSDISEANRLLERKD